MNSCIPDVLQVVRRSDFRISVSSTGAKFFVKVLIAYCEARSVDIFVDISFRNLNGSKYYCDPTAFGPDVADTNYQKSM